jgi:type I restriction enzyme S subunit
MAGESRESICKRLKITPEILDLFPDRLVDSELGEIPEGWEISTVSRIADVIDCLHSRKPERRTSGFPLLQLENIRDDGLLDMTNTYFVDQIDYKKWISRLEAREGVCVITNVGRVGAIAQVPHGVRAALGRNMTAIRCKEEFPFESYLFYCLRSAPMRAEINNKTDCGTILDALNVKSIPNLSFFLPRKELIRHFDLTVRPARRMMDLTLKNIIDLSKVRDTLLPKLISGEIRVPEVEHFLESVTR